MTGQHASTVLPEFRAPLGRTESIHDTSQSSDEFKSREPHEIGHRDGSSSPLEGWSHFEQRTDVHGANAIKGASYELVHSPKRRRLSGPETPSTRSHDSASNSREPATYTPRRFLPSGVPPLSLRPPCGSSSTAIAASEQQQQQHRPPFLLPPTPAPTTEPKEPLPDVFSPHRRGKKFIPGGMAETMRDWVIDVSQGLQRQRQGDSRRWGDGQRATEVGRLWVITAEQDDGGPLLVTGKWTDRSDGMNLPGFDEAIERANQQQVDRALLINAGANRRNSTDELQSGCQVSLRPPCWRAEIGEQQWIVCADWNIIG